MTTMKAPINKGIYLSKFKVPKKRGAAYLKKALSKKYTYNVLEGSKRGGKTKLNIIPFCEALDNTMDSIHLAIGQTQTAARTILGDSDGLGIFHYPDFQERIEVIDGKRYHFPQRMFKGQFEGNDALMLLPKAGSGRPVKYIVFFGASQVDSHDGYTGYDIGLVIGTQFELWHSNSRNEIKARTFASTDRRIFLDLNPVDPLDPVYEQLDQWEKSGILNYEHLTLHDNPGFGKKRIAEIIAEYDPESVAFQRDVLGLRVSAAGQIYRVRDYNLIDKFNPNDYAMYRIIADPGVNASATVFGLVAITKNYKYVDVLKAYRHRNEGEEGHGVKMPSDYVDDFHKFIDECIDLMGFLPYDIRSDLDLTFKREFERTKNKRGHGMFNFLDVVKEEIDDRIRTGITLLYKGRLRFHKTDAADVVYAFKSAIYDPKRKKKGIFERYDEPTKGTRIDEIDMTEYGFTLYRRELALYRGD